MIIKRQTLVLLLYLLFSSGSAVASEVRIAVASNFSETIRHIAALFEQQSGHRIILIFGSTGKHYAQIKNGAPFTAFFAADAKRPQLLEQEGVAQPGSRFTYAVGRVVLWSPTPDKVDDKGMVLKSDKFRYLALANPKLAPYGKAAEQVLRAEGVWTKLQGRMVRGENIAQTFQFVNSGNAALGFVAYSQIRRPGTPVTGSFWEPPQSLYNPIEQQAVLLQNSSIGREFLEFVKSDRVRNIIRDYGYGVP